MNWWKKNSPTQKLLLSAYEPTPETTPRWYFFDIDWHHYNCCGYYAWIESPGWEREWIFCHYYVNHKKKLCIYWRHSQQPHIIFTTLLKHVFILLCEFLTMTTNSTKIFMYNFSLTLWCEYTFIYEKKQYHDVDHVMTSPCFGFLIDVILWRINHL